MKKIGLFFGVLLISISVFGQSKKEQIEELKKDNEQLKIKNEQCEREAERQADIARSNLTKAIVIEKKYRSEIEFYKQKGNLKDEKIAELKSENSKLKNEVDSLKKLLEKKKAKVSNNQTNPSFLFEGNGGNSGGNGVGSLGIGYGDYNKNTNNVFISSITGKHARKIKGPRGYKWSKAQKKTALYFFEVIADHEGNILMVLPFEGRSNLTTDDEEILNYIRETLKFYPVSEEEKLFPQKIKVNIVKDRSDD